MSTAATDDKELTQLLKKKLAIKDDVEAALDDKSRRLQQELDRSGFTIFRCIADHGFFSWIPGQGSSEVSYKSLSSMSSSTEIKERVDMKGKPNTLVPISSLRLPQRFHSLAPQENENKFPYGQYDVASLYVAVQARGVDLDSIDFFFGGSTLEMLANQDSSDPFMLTRIPGKKTILIVKRKDYTQNLSDVGFQFERLVTGHRMEDRLPIEKIEHLQVMKIGPHQVLFRAEADAVSKEDRGAPVEIKASNPRYWGTKVMFQMISNGSTKLCHGFKSRGQLVSVTLKSLHEVSSDALVSTRLENLEKNILDGMKDIMATLDDLSLSSGEQGNDHQVYRVTFSSGSLRLLPANGRSAVLLPPANIVSELI